jgi:DnaJ family protein C protein 8
MSKVQEQQAEVDRILKCKPNDHFAVLALDIATCEYDDVKKAHKKVVLNVHPDKCQGGVQRAGDAFSVADKAYKTLSDENMFKRFKEAWARKHTAATAAKNLAAGGKAAAGVEDEMQAQREREERYLQAVREHTEQVTKKHRTETERKNTERAKADIEEQMAHFDKMRTVYGTSTTAPAVASTTAATRKAHVQR